MENRRNQQIPRNVPVSRVFSESFWWSHKGNKVTPFFWDPPCHWQQYGKSSPKGHAVAPLSAGNLCSDLPFKASSSCSSQSSELPIKTHLHSTGGRFRINFESQHLKHLIRKYCESTPGFKLSWAPPLSIAPHAAATGTTEVNTLHGSAGNNKTLVQCRGHKTQIVHLFCLGSFHPDEQHHPPQVSRGRCRETGSLGACKIHQEICCCFFG